MSSLLHNVNVLFSPVLCSANKVADFVARYVNKHGWLGGEPLFLIRFLVYV